MDDSCNDAGEDNYEQRFVLKINDKMICLICKLVINSNICTMDSDKESLTPHFQNEMHKMKLKTLFDEYVTDPCTDCNYLDFINGCVFDLSLYLGNEPSYVSQCGCYIICHICSIKLSGVNSDETVLLEHLGSETHEKNLKHWSCWIYFFHENHNFVLLSQRKVFCSFCKRTFKSTDNLLQMLIMHLEYMHGIRFTKSNNEIVKNDHMGDEHHEKKDEINESTKLCDFLDHDHDDNSLNRSKTVKMDGDFENFEDNPEIRNNDMEGNNLDTNLVQVELKCLVNPKEVDSLDNENCNHQQKNPNDAQKNENMLDIAQSCQKNEEEGCSLEIELGQNELKCFKDVKNVNNQMNVDVPHPAKSCEYSAFSDHFGNRQRIYEDSQKDDHKENFQSMSKSTSLSNPKNEIKDYYLENQFVQRRKNLKLVKEAESTEEAEYFMNNDVNRPLENLELSAKCDGLGNNNALNNLDFATKDSQLNIEHFHHTMKSFQGKNHVHSLMMLFKNLNIHQPSDNSAFSTTDCDSDNNWPYRMYREDYYPSLPKTVDEGLTMDNQKIEEHQEYVYSTGKEKNNIQLKRGNLRSCDVDVGDVFVDETCGALGDSSEKSSDDVYYMSDYDGNALETDDFSGSLNDFSDAFEGLICPTCGDVIDILNENAEFSLQLHSQKHKDLKNVNKEEELTFNADVDYVCPVCQEMIPIYNKNIELSVSRHFEERKEDHEGFGFAEGNKLSSDVIAKSFSTFPDFLKKYQSFIDMEENLIYCKLCNCTVPLKNDEEDISNNLQEHLSNPYHEEQWKALSQDLASAVVDYNRQCENVHRNQQEGLLDSLAKKHPIIEIKRQFFTIKGSNYFCKICQRHICYSPNEKTLALNFKSHLKGYWHVQAFKEKNNKNNAKPPSCKSGKRFEKPVSSLKENQTLEGKMMSTFLAVCNKYAEVSINKNFIKIRLETGSFYCEICKETIEFSQSGSKLKSHCNSQAHNEILTRTATILVAKSIEPRKRDSNDNLKSIKDALSQFQFLKPHLQFVFTDKDSDICWCILCNVTVPGTEKNIREHLLGNNHNHIAYPAFKKVIEKKRTPVNARMSGQFKRNQSKHITKTEKVLAKLIRYSPIVGMNSEFLGVKEEGYFYCDICAESLKADSSGKLLRIHLNSENHVRLLKEID